MANDVCVNLDGLTYDGTAIEARILDGFVEIECNGYLSYRSHRCPQGLAEMVREGFAEHGERMDAEQRRELALWDEVETLVADAWEATA